MRHARKRWRIFKNKRSVRETYPNARLWATDPEGPSVWTHTSGTMLARGRTLNEAWARAAGTWHPQFKVSDR